MTSTLTLDRFVLTRTSGSHSRISRIVPFIQSQAAMLAASFRAARAYERAESVDASQEALDRFARHMRS